MAKKKAKLPKFEVRAEQEWVDRLDRVAHRLSLSRSAFVRMAVTRFMDEEDRRVERERK